MHFDLPTPLPADRYRAILNGMNPDYIHAVMVNGYKSLQAFIIAQTPLPSTVGNFWKLISDRKVGVVVQLTALKEGGREVCAPYWPALGQEELRCEGGEGIVVRVEGERELVGGCTVRTLSLTHSKVSKSCVNFAVARIFLFGSRMRQLSK